MSEQSYYIRSGRRVRGPFDFDRLVSMRDKGRLQRTDELSNDQANWISAETVDGLFPPVLDPGPRATWFYNSGDEQIGPLTLEQMQAEAEGAMLLPDDTVWCEGSDDWVPAHSVRELRPAFGAEAVRAAKAQPASGSPRGVLILASVILLAVAGAAAGLSALNGNDGGVAPPTPLPHIVTDVPCPECHGHPTNCDECGGNGKSDCSACGGDGDFECTNKWTRKILFGTETYECHAGDIYCDGRKTGHRCDKCNGRGTVKCQSCKGKGEDRGGCRICGGSGQLRNCARCGGKGTIRK